MKIEDIFLFTLHTQFSLYGDIMNYSIFFPTPLTEIDPIDDNLDVCLRLEDGRSYTFTITTPDHLKTQMYRDNLTYLPPGAPMLIVERITQTNIQALIESMLNDSVLLAMYGSDYPRM